MTEYQVQGWYNQLVTRQQAGQSRVLFLQGQEFLSSSNQQTSCVAHPASYWLDTESFFFGGGGYSSRGVHFTAHPCCFTEVKNVWSSTFTPSMCLHGMYGTNLLCSTFWNISVKKRQLFRNVCISNKYLHSWLYGQCMHILVQKLCCI